MTQTKQNEPIPTTLGPLIPLSFERFRICELYAELLHCSNMSLLNRPPEFDALYDEEGRLKGGLPALEDLARVIAIGSGGDEQSLSCLQVEKCGQNPALREHDIPRSTIKSSSSGPESVTGRAAADRKWTAGLIFTPPSPREGSRPYLAGRDTITEHLAIAMGVVYR